MIFQESEDTRYFQFSIFKNYPITQAIFSRNGGYSPAPWHSLNVGNTVGDHPDIVRSNLNKLLFVLGYGKEQLAQVHQVHSARVVHIEEPNSAGEELQNADAMVTNKDGILLLMRFADCVPIFLFDPVEKTIGIAHAGWKGTVSKIGFETVKTMENKFGSLPENIIAGIGPSIGQDHYPVGSEVVQLIKESFPKRWQDILLEDYDGVKLDLWKANAIILRNAGIKTIEISEICTACHRQDWFSHRGDEGKTGRFAAVIGLD